MKIKEKIAFIGTGFMAGAMIDGIIRGGVQSPENIIAVNEAFPESAAETAEKYGVVHGSATDIAKCSIVVFGVKPQIFAEAVEMYGEYFTNEKLYLSIMAGVSTSKLEDALRGARVIRFMPNMPLSVGASATVYALGSCANESDAETAEKIFSPLGLIRRVEEDMISAVTALSGSGPAYFCRLTEAMTSAAIKSGLDIHVARELAIQTLIGTAKLIEKTGIAPDELRRRVTSKKGTTEAALDAMSATKFDEAVTAGFEAARLRSDELGRNS